MSKQNPNHECCERGIEKSVLHETTNSSGFAEVNDSEDVIETKDTERSEDNDLC